MAHRILITSWLALALALALVLVLGAMGVTGCDGVAQDDDSIDDDDTTPSDDDDDTTPTDDDDDAVPVWFYYSFTLDMTGGTPNPTGTLYLEITSYEDSGGSMGDEICVTTMAYDATAEVGLGIHDTMYWQYIDTVINWSGPGTEVDNTCSWGPEELFGIGWDVALAWDNDLGPPFNPLAMVSCDTIRGNANLAELHLGPDPYEFTAGETFGEHCEEVGAVLQEDTYGFGPMEGIWTLPMSDGWLGSDYSYYPPEDTAIVPAWGFFGWWLEDPENVSGAGLDGAYYSITGWVLG